MRSPYLILSYLTYVVVAPVSIARFLNEEGDNCLREQSDYLGSQNYLSIDAPLKGSHEREIRSNAGHLLHTEGKLFDFIRLWTSFNLGSIFKIRSPRRLRH